MGKSTVIRYDQAPILRPQKNMEKNQTQSNAINPVGPAETSIGMILTHQKNGLKVDKTLTITRMMHHFRLLGTPVYSISRSARSQVSHGGERDREGVRRAEKTEYVN
jgi:hypothetical protein